MDILLSIDGVAVRVPYSSIVTITNDLEGTTPTQRDALIRLATHDDYEIRSVVAGKANLPEGCYLKLADDPSVDVISQLLTNSSFHQCASLSVYQAIARRDPKLSSQLGMCLNDVDSDLQPALGQWLIDQGDYKTRFGMADSAWTPQPVLELLSHDADAAIATAAISNLTVEDAESNDWEDFHDENLDEDE